MSATRQELTYNPSMLYLSWNMRTENRWHMDDKSYERITTVAGIVAIIAAVIYDNVPALKIMAISVAIFAAVVSIGAYLYRHLKSKEKQCE